MKYRIYAALYEEATDGWVWLANPRVEPHRLITLKNQDVPCRPIIYCEARVLDANFAQFYNSKPHTRKIDLKDSSDVLVIGDWYRQALGITGTKTDVDLDVSQPRNPFWSALKAGSQHPDPTVRLANRLGLLSAWLGLLGILGAVDPFVTALKKAITGHGHDVYSAGGWLLFIILAGCVCMWAARGVRRIGNST